MRLMERRMIGVCILMMSAQSAHVLAQHDDDFIVGRTGSGQLAVEFDFGESSALPAVQGVLRGFALADPGFMALSADEPGEDFFTLQDGANVVFEVVSFSPAVSAWTPGFLSRLDQPGERWTLGGPGFDTHATWHVDANHPAFDALGGPWSASFRLLDLGTTGYASSPDYTVNFVPEPSMMLLGLSVIALALRGSIRR